jgi:hypothetical protein
MASLSGRRLSNQLSTALPLSVADPKPVGRDNDNGRNWLE